MPSDKTKAAAFHEFMSSFGLTAYAATAVPDSAEMPYITYTWAEGAWGDGATAVQADIWYRTESEAEPNAKVAELSKRLGLGGVCLPCEAGVLWVRRGSPFAQAVEDADNSVKRRYINLELEFETLW